MKKIVITKIPLKYFYYFQYLIFGLHELERAKVIILKIKPASFIDYIFYRFYFLFIVLNKYSSSFRMMVKEQYLLEGYCEENDKKVYFCYDIADSPNFYDIDKLKIVDIYFKAQCPIHFNRNGFELTSRAVLPYPNGLFEYIEKIKPSMLGPGFKVNNIFSHSKLKNKYEEMLVDDSKVFHKKSIMCYFGNSKGAKAVKVDNPDLYAKESHILGFFDEKVAHPNIKRGIAAKILTEILPDSDARIIHEGNSDAGYRPSKSPLFIPIESFSRHISDFRYNLNISGHRMSIPYRFIHSFAVGTSIVTDKLKLKWYLPFGKEVIETVEMGYLPVNEVDWVGFKEQIKNLPVNDSKEIRNAYNEKWSPKAFALYIVNALKK